MSKNGTLGIWFNKRGLASLEFPMRHSLTTAAEGYVIEFQEAGKLTANFIDHQKQSVDVIPGDRLRSSGEEFYLLLERDAKTSSKGG
jgi:hypothetical protein